MSRIPIHPGEVDWSGENPGMYLKETADGPFVGLVSFFRVVLSAHGAGHGAFILFDPHGDGTNPERPNLCLSDNRALCEYLRENFVANFGAFKGTPGLANLSFEAAGDFTRFGVPRTHHTETFRSARGEVVLTWRSLGEPFMVEMPKERSATGRHEMFSLFVDAHAAHASVGALKLAGRAFPRDFAGKASSTAFLAFSETWVRA